MYDARGGEYIGRRVLYMYMYKYGINRFILVIGIHLCMSHHDDNSYTCIMYMYRV